MTSRRCNAASLHNRINGRGLASLQSRKLPRLQACEEVRLSPCHLQFHVQWQIPLRVQAPIICWSTLQFRLVRQQGQDQGKIWTNLVLCLAWQDFRTGISEWAWFYNSAAIFGKKVKCSKCQPLEQTSSRMQTSALSQSAASCVSSKIRWMPLKAEELWRSACLTSL